MYRALQVYSGKPIEIVKAGGALTRGMVATYAPATGTVTAATGTDAVCFVDVAPNYNGINAAITPNDTAFEKVEEGDLVLKVVPNHGEHFATNQITASGLKAGDLLQASAGKLVKASGSVGQFVYVGAYSDPDFSDMHEVYYV